MGQRFLPAGLDRPENKAKWLFIVWNVFLKQQSQVRKCIEFEINQLPCSETFFNWMFWIKWRNKTFWLTWQSMLPSEKKWEKRIIIWILTKDAGFVHESFRNETNRIFWDFFSYETNPRNEFFENCVTKRIHETNLLNTVVRNESAKRIFWTP